MNERTRRHQQARRTTQASHSGNPYQQHNNRSIYHAHPADTYSASNYRHPSSTTTTTTTDPSSIAASRSSSSTSSDCDTSICYLYLIAIVSSFLVVLGIYFSLTRFDARFLYISLLGLSIEAIGACIYCVNNIRTSRLAKRKHRLESDEFILGGSGGNIDNQTLAENISSAVNQTQQERPPRQVTTITHILSNRNLTGSNTNIDNNIHNINESNSSAINNDTQHSQQLQMPTEPLENSQAIVDESSSGFGQDGAFHSGRDHNSILISPAQNELQEDQTDFIACTSPATNTSPDLLPETQSCQQSATTTSGDFSSSTNLLDNQQEQAINQTNMNQRFVATSDMVIGDNEVLRDERSVTIASQSNTQLSDDRNKKSQEINQQQLLTTVGIMNETPDVLRDLPSTSNLPALPNEIVSLTNNNNNIELHQNQQNDNSDLMNLHNQGIGLVPSSPTEAQVIKGRAGQCQQRPTNLRRTLVMGISGEQEMIEIDEEDLDNMSILPPSYESIAANQQQRQESS